jgi:hypothetical protein
MKPVRIREEGGYTSPPKAKTFCGLIYVPDLDLGEVLRSLEWTWGPVEFISQRFPFDYTRYYDREMGFPLLRKFVTFREEVEQEALPEMKWEAKRVEGNFLHPTGGRRVNIDPGLLLPDRLVLATTKPCAHRPYLARGVYADLTLVYRDNSYQPLEWTYPDYAASQTVNMMNSLRVHSFLRERASRRGRIE